MLKIKELELKFKADLADVERCVKLSVRTADILKDLIATTSDLVLTLERLRVDLAHPFETVDQ